MMKKLKYPYKIVSWGYLGQEDPPERVADVTQEPYDDRNFVDGKIHRC